MSSSRASETSYEIIEQKKEAYLEEIPEPDSDWPSDVRVVYEELLDQLFDWGRVEAQEVLEECGLYGHEIYTRFRHVTGYGIKGFVVYHRIQLAKRLLRYDSLSVSEIAFAVGYSSPSGFSKMFKRRVGDSPMSFRQQEEG